MLKPAAQPMLTRSAHQRWVIPALYATAVVVFSDMYLTQPILPILAHEYGLQPASTGLSVSLVVLLIALGSFLVGPLSDQRGRRPIVVASCLLLALPTLLCGLAPSFELLLLCRALQGLCIPGITAVAVAYFGELVEPGQLGRVVGGWIAANVAGGLVSRIASGLITEYAGWRMAFFCFAVLTLACGIVLALVLPHTTQPAAGGWGSAYRGMFAHLRNRRLVGAFLIGAALFFGFLGIYTYLPFYLAAAPFRLSPATIALAYVSYLAGVVVSPLSGRLSNRIDRRILITLGLAIAMTGMLLTLVPLLPAIVASLFVLCTGMFTAQAIMPAFVNTLARSAKGGASALYLASYYLGGTLGAVVPGFAWQAAGWHGVVAVCITALAIALLSNWWLCGE